MARALKSYRRFLVTEVKDVKGLKKEKHGFQTEVKQLLNLMIHSLYSNKEVAIRELVSNASDACDKLRYLSLSDASLMKEDSDLKITIDIDRDARLLMIKDNGVGMTRDEIVDHLGTIAKSGTKEFASKLTGDQAKDSLMIGQFGVGFYSSFMIADKVTVISRKAGLDADSAVRWESLGDGEYTVENVTKLSRGTEVILHLKADADEYLEFYKVRSIALKYSDHISLPILMKEPVTAEKDKDGKELPTPEPEYKAINKATAIWTRARTDIKEEEYKEFYQNLTYDFNPPMDIIHTKVEGNQQFTTLLYIPSRAPFDLWDRERKSGLKLYVKRVFIMDNANMLPGYLRFIKGVIDSDDLPLNVSREILQGNKLVDAIKAACVKKVLQSLGKMAESEPQKYADFYKAFGNVLKEGPAEDFANKDKIIELLRFSTTHTDQEAQTVSLKEYVSRMKSDQKFIYYVTAENFTAAKNSPLLELFRKKGIEVLLMSDRVDEWLMAYVPEFDGKAFQSVSKGDLALEETEEEKKAHEEKAKNFDSVFQQIKEVLKDKIEDVRLTHRLTDSPSCVVVDKDAMSIHLQRMIQMTGQAMPSNKPILELNPDHALVLRLKTEADDEIFSDLTTLLFEQAMLTEGGQLEDPASFVKRVNRFIK
jgi:molecular chaperone HtpG